MTGFPKTLDEYVEIARTLVERHGQSEDAASVMAAIVATDHVMDWFRKSFAVSSRRQREDFRIWFAAEFPAWDVLRDLANGTKHADLTSLAPLTNEDPVPSLSLSWASNAFWDGRAWTVKAALPPNNILQRHLVISLCSDFLAEFGLKQSGISAPFARIVP